MAGKPFFDTLGDPMPLLKTATIVGTGQNVNSCLDKIPVDSYRFGLNGAVELPIMLHAWCVFDHRVKNHDYYNHDRKLVSYMGIHAADERADFTFETTHNDYIPFPWGKFSGWCTVAGVALSICYWRYIVRGVPDTVYFAGCDFRGGYWDGTPSGKLHEWSHLGKMNIMLDFARSRGMKLYTLSDTALEVEHAD